MTMLKLIPRHRFQVPHGLAVVGALLLLVSTVTGFGTTLSSQQTESAAAAPYVSSSEMETAQSADAVPQPPVKQKQRFRINLFLFRG